MTIGSLARRTGVAVKTLRKYEDMGLIYTAGRSPGNYRLFEEEALWCVRTVGLLREVGLTLEEIRDLARTYLGARGEPVGPRLAGILQSVRARTERQIAALSERLQRLDAFETAFAAELTGRADFHDLDPRGAGPDLTLPAGAGCNLAPR